MTERATACTNIFALAAWTRDERPVLNSSWLVPWAVIIWESLEANGPHLWYILGKISGFDAGGIVRIEPEPWEDENPFSLELGGGWSAPEIYCSNNGLMQRLLRIEPESSRVEEAWCNLFWLWLSKSAQNELRTRPSEKEDERGYSFEDG
ncbi:hypothetical protein K438DRAFT_1785329 [Mycena galopus ATCC 62051]|nr:hypothetical protein K438DRAFT_1785329 [Mycena galopus ATCC 62051]